MLHDLEPSTKILKWDSIEPSAYVFTHVKTGMMYIGSSAQPVWRRMVHMSMLKRGVHGNKAFQEAYNDCDRVEYKFFVAGTRERAYDVEQGLLDYYMPSGKLFNIALDARAPRNGLYTEEDRQRLRTLRLGTKSTPEHVAKIRKALTGRKQSEEHRRNSQVARTGIPLSEEHRAKVTEASKKFQKAVSVNGVVYPGVRECSRQINVEQSLVRHRVKSKLPRYNDWFFVT